MTLDTFRRRLLALWHEAEEGEPADLQRALYSDPENRAGRDYCAWAGATKDLLLALGMVATADRDDYTFEDAKRKG